MGVVGEVRGAWCWRPHGYGHSPTGRSPCAWVLCGTGQRGMRGGQAGLELARPVLHARAQRGRKTQAQSTAPGMQKGAAISRRTRLTHQFCDVRNVALYECTASPIFMLCSFSCRKQNQLDNRRPASIALPTPDTLGLAHIAAAYHGSRPAEVRCGRKAVNSFGPKTTSDGENGESCVP